MKSAKYKNIFRRYLIEFLTPIDSEIINLKKHRTAAIVRLIVIVPTIYLLTLSTLIAYKKTAYDQAASSILLLVWILQFVIYIALNLLIIQNKNLRISRVLTYLCIFLEISSNQICVYATGSLTSHAVIFIVICICIYRIFFDYYISLFCTISSCILYVTTAVLEFNKVIPRSPYLSSPIQHQVYSTPLMACSFISVIILGAFITFFAVNFSINQTLKLNRYIMNNWKNDLTCLHEFSQGMTAATNFDDIITLTFKAIIQTKSFDAAAFMILNNKNKLIMKSSFGWKHDWIEKYTASPLIKESPVIKNLFEQKSLFTVDDIAKYPDLLKTLNGIPIKSICIFPFILDSNEYGILLIANTETRVISEHQMKILSSITNQADIALQNLTNLSKEIKKASTDGLTELYNRRYFDEQLSSAVNEAINNSSHLSLIMMDVDNFKKYNDTYGHQAGDELLRAVAQTATQCVRSKDIVARYGGEEFVVILKDSDISTTLPIAERIRSSVESIQLGKLNSKVTISIGVGTLQNQCRDAQALIKSADKSLYFAKHNGKNRVCFGWLDESDSQADA